MAQKVKRRRITFKFDRFLKSLLEFKALLIAAGFERKEVILIFRFLKNIQPISVGV